jgi:hypothetical protein
MADLQICSDTIGAFAQSCEEMNAYARRLWDLVDYQRVFTHANIRNYENG